MGFKKHDWSKYGYSRKGNILKIEVCDESERRIDFFFSNNQDKHKQIGRVLREKYGIDLSPEINNRDSINNKRELKKEVDEETKWLDKDLEW